MKVVTYRFAHRPGTVDLCPECADEPDMSRRLADVQHGLHEGRCFACDVDAALADLARDGIVVPAEDSI